jgi:hypothetical protein
MNSRSLLADLLDVAVPIQLIILDEMDPAERPEAITRWAAGAVDLIACSDASLLFPVKASPQTDRHAAEPGTAATFAALARGIAAGAHAPGGITAFGRHWCVNHDRCVEAEQSHADQGTCQSAANSDQISSKPGDDHD